MLRLDMARMLDDEISSALCERCSHFGSVLTVAVFRAGKDESFPFALVEMSAPGEVAQVVQELGDLTFGGSALIKLQQVNFGTD
jgi:hypothetical protein